MENQQGLIEKAALGIYDGAKNVYGQLLAILPGRDNRGRVGLLYLFGGSTFIIYVWRRIWEFLKKEMIVQMTIDSREEIFKWVMQWVATNHEVERLRRLNVTIDRTQIRRFRGRKEQRIDNDKPDIKFLPGTGWHHLIFQGRHLWMQRRTGNTTVSLRDSTQVETIIIWTLGRSNKIVQDLVIAARDAALATDSSKTKIFALNKWLSWETVVTINPRRLDTVILEDQMVTDLHEDVQEFFNSAAWYTSRGVPYRRGYLLYGEPGCGKTSFVKAVASELQLDICVLNLSRGDLDDKALENVLREAPKRSLLLLEDIDAVFVDRESVAIQGVKMVSFSGLLNALDGVSSQEGRVYFLTTNHIEKLDPALIRPGRCDRKVRFTLATTDQVYRLFLQFFPEEYDHAHAFAESLPPKTLSMAKIQGHLVQYKADAFGAVDNFKELLEDTEPASKALPVRVWLRRLGGTAFEKHAPLFQRESIYYMDQLQGLSVRDIEKLQPIPMGHKLKIIAMLSGNDKAKHDFEFAKKADVKRILKEFYSTDEQFEPLVSQLLDSIPDKCITLGEVKCAIGEAVDLESTTKRISEVAQSPASEEVVHVAKEPEAKEPTVKELLDDIELSDYYQAFEDNACATIDVFKKLNDSDLQGVIGISTFGHRRKIMNEIEKLNQNQTFLSPSGGPAIGKSRGGGGGGGGQGGGGGGRRRRRG